MRLSHLIMTMTAVVCAFLTGSATARATLDPFNVQSAIAALTAVDPDIATIASTDSSHDFAVGGGQDAFTQFGFAAQDTPNGPSGFVRIDQFAEGCCGAFTVEGPVTCLTVVGGYATIGIQIAKGNGTAVGLEGDGFFLFVQDNGPPVGGQPVDLFSNSGFFPSPQFGTCSVFFTPIFPLTSGNIVVNHA
jgi:hypothetical protein